MNNPLNAPIEETAESFFLACDLASWKACTFNTILKPTKSETDTARIKFNGINNTDKFSVSLMVAIGKYPGDPQHKVNAKDGKFIVSSDTSVGT
jgi:hypothetical protein